MTVIAAFDPRITLTNTVTGGVNTIDRAIVLQAGEQQKTAAARIQEIFAGRIGDAQTALDASSNGATIDSLTQSQSLLASRKDRVNQALGLLNSAQTQIDFIKSNIGYLRDQVDSYQAGDITASELITTWDNVLRTINTNSDDAAKLYKDAGVYFQRNLLGSSSRTTYTPQTVIAPTSINGNTIQIDGIYLGSDYYITEDGTGDVYLSTAGFRADQTDTAQLVEYTSYPDTPSGVTADTSTITVNSFDTTSGTIQFTSAGTGTVDGTLTRGGLGLLDSFLYQSGGTGTFDATTAEVDLDAAEATALDAQSQFRYARQTLASQVDLYNNQITALQRDITQQVSQVRSDREAKLVSEQLKYAIARFNFTLLAAKGNTLIRSLMNAQDNQGKNEFDTVRSGQLVSGSLVDVQT